MRINLSYTQLSWLYDWSYSEIMTHYVCMNGQMEEYSLHECFEGLIIISGYVVVI